MEERGVYIPKGHRNDRVGQKQGSGLGRPGGTLATHAEKIVHTLVGDAPIGVSRDMCGDCQGYFRSEAKSRDFLVVADSSEPGQASGTVRIFLPDDQVKSPSDFD
jgi:hypothetical protein